MKTFINKLILIMAFHLTGKRINAQNFNDYRDAEAGGPEPKYTIFYQDWRRTG